jgi:hypothetical protein
MRYLFLITLFIAMNFSKAQVGIGTNAPHSSAKLDLTSTSKGVLIPRMTNTQMAAISGLSDTHVFDLKVGEVVAFKTAAGKFGFFKVKSINQGIQGGDDIQKYQDGDIEIDVKVQK